MPKPPVKGSGLKTTKYALNEIKRRPSRTALTALGLSAGVGLVMGIVGISDGLTQAQSSVLSPLTQVGTDIIVTRTVAATTSTSATTSSSSSSSGNQGGGGGGFFRTGPGGGNAAFASLNSQDAAALLNANSSIITDLAKLGPAGTKFTHDFFVPGTLITFPSEAISVISKLQGVKSDVGALSLQGIHETGTVPRIVDTVQTGGQTITSTARPAPLTAAEEAQVQSCLASHGVTFNRPATSATGSGSQRGQGLGGGGDRFGGFLTQCLPARFQTYISQVVVPEQTITRVLNPPTTNTATTTYTVGGVNPASPNSGLVTKSQVTSGTWFTSTPAHEVLVNTAYASTNKIKVGQTLTYNSVSFKVVGLVAPTLTGNISDVYFDLSTLQSMASDASRVNEVLVSVTNSAQVDKVAAEIKNALPGAQVLTAKSLADQVTGSLSNAHKLANTLGGALAVVVMVAAFLIAMLLTLSSVTKRTREIGTLRAIGWSKAKVVSQIVLENLGIAVVGAIVGVGIGYGISAIIGQVAPSLSVVSSGLAVGASSASSLFHEAASGSLTTYVKLSAPISAVAVAEGVVLALVGGVLAGAIGGWRAARLAPATALRDIN